MASGYLTVPSANQEPKQYDFANQNISFTFEHEGFNLGSDGGEITLCWEEANDGDFDNDGMVTVADLTPVALYLDGTLDIDWHYTVDTNSDLPFELCRTDENISVYAISALSEGITDGMHGLLPRYDTTNYSLAYAAGLSQSPYGLPNSIYEVTEHDITKLGMTYGNSVVGGYSVFLLRDDVEQPDSQFCIGLVRRPDYTGQDLDHPYSLGFVDENHDYAWVSYDAFRLMDEYPRYNSSLPYDETHWFDDDRPGRLLREKPVYYFNRNLYDIEGAYDFIKESKRGGVEVHIALVPLPSRSFYYEYGISEERIRDRSVHPTAFDLSTIDDASIDELDYTSNIRASIRSGHYNLRVDFDYAELLEGYDPDEYAIRYAIYYSDTEPVQSNPSGLFMNGADGLPYMRYFPESGDFEVYRRVANYCVFPESAAYAGKTLYVGVRAYIQSLMDPGTYGPLDDNIAFDSIEMPDPWSDTTDPVFEGMASCYDAGLMSFNVYRTGEYYEVPPAEERENEDDPFDTYYEVINSTAPHMVHQGESGMGYAIINNRVYINTISDVNDSGMKTSYEDLEVRMEIYRTQADAGEILNYVHPTTYATGPTEWRESNEEDLMAVALAWPASDDVFESDDWFRPSNRNIMAPSYYLPVISPFTDIDTSGEDELGEYRSYNFWPVSGTADDLPGTEFTRYSPFAFDGGEYADCEYISLCYDPDIDSGVNPYNYVVFTAVNDLRNNCSYGDTTGDHQFKFFKMPMEWGFWSYLHEDEWNEYLESIKSGQYGSIVRSGHSPSSTSVNTPQARGMSVASCSLNSGPDASSILGWTYVDSVNRKLIFSEMNLSNGSVVVQEVCAASIGNTSIAYDSAGNAHVLYYLSSSDDDDESGAVAGPIGLSRSTSSTGDEWARVYYRVLDRNANSWSAREEVNDSYLASHLEHTIEVLNDVPHCVVATEEDMETSPLVCVKSGSSWQHSSIDTIGTESSQYIDSIYVGDTCYIVAYSSDMGVLQLIEKTSMVTLTTELLLVGATGHQAVCLLDDDNLGIAYQAEVGCTPVLGYAIWNISSRLLVSMNGVCSLPYSGYNCDITTYNEELPIIFHYERDSGQLVATYLDDGEWYSIGLGFTNWDDNMIDFNTIEITKVGDTIYYVAMGVLGGIVHGSLGV